MRTHDDDDATTMLQHRFQPSPLPEGTFVLTVVEGADAGKRFELDGSQPQHVLVGSGPACAVRLTDRQVSRRHLSLEIEGARLKLTDVGSRNGTRVDDLEVLSVLLKGGETIRIGSTALRVAHTSESKEIELPSAARFGRMVGASRELRRLHPLCTRLAASNVPLIVEGETGTGKEVLAESIHEEGPRADGPFVVFDCTAVAPNLIEAELFGHERGAFTGAASAHAGVFEQAHGGTLFIDEIGDLPLQLQSKLLRAVERSEVRRLGGDKTIRVDVRVVAATRRNLDREVEAGRFRDDLYHRLAVGRIELPPLRERRGDVSVLAAHFASEMAPGRAAGSGVPPAGLPNDLVARWEAYDWPGNVRELRNAVARFLALGEVDTRAPITARDSGDSIIETVLAQKLPLTRARQIVVDEFERRYVERALAEHGGVVTRAAESAGIARRHFNRVRARVSK
jgi:DNA-binding NtrC family response regulator